LTGHGADGDRPGQLRIVLALTVSDTHLITAIDVVADPERLRLLRLAMLPD